jgi:hypothetical protein
MERLWAMTGTQLKSFEDTGGDLPKVLGTAVLALARSPFHTNSFSQLLWIYCVIVECVIESIPTLPLLTVPHVPCVSSSLSSGLWIHSTRHPLRRGPPRRCAEQNRSEGKRGRGRSCILLLQAETTHPTNIQSGIQVQRP